MNISWLSPGTSGWYQKDSESETIGFNSEQMRHAKVQRMCATLNGTLTGLRAAWKVLKSTLQSNLGQIALHAKDNSALLGRRLLAGMGSPNAAIVSDAVHPLRLNSI